MAQRTLHSSPSENQTTIFPSICWGRAWWYHSKSDTYLSSHHPIILFWNETHIKSKDTAKTSQLFFRLPFSPGSESILRILVLWICKLSSVPGKCALTFTVGFSAAFPGLWFLLYRLSLYFHLVFFFRNS